MDALPAIHKPATAHPHRRQLFVLGALVALNACLAFITYAWLPFEQMMGGATASAGLPELPAWQLGLANAGIVLVVYGLAGLAGYAFARKLGLPGVFREGAGWRTWLGVPAALGAAVGVLLVIFDRLFAGLTTGFEGFAHPPFPLSLVASATAGIGEEIIFRGFVMGLWALIFAWLMRWRRNRAALWIGNGIGALAFAAGHLPAVMFLLGAATPAEIPGLVLGELFLLNGLVALVAGERYMQEGLIAAVGVHFWADIVWHVVWPLL